MKARLAFPSNCNIPTPSARTLVRSAAAAAIISLNARLQLLYVHSVDTYTPTRKIFEWGHKQGRPGFI